MLKKMLAVCGVGLFSLITVQPVTAQTLVLKDGQRPSGQLVDLSGAGFTLRVNGQDQTFPVNDVASVEFQLGAPPVEAQARINASQPLVVLRNGQIVEGRLVDIGGSRSERLTVQTSTGTREFTIDEVSQVYLSAPNNLVASNARDGRNRSGRVRLSAQNSNVIVPGNQAWTNSGVQVNSQERLVFATGGDIKIAPNASSGVSGSPAATAASVRYPLADAPVGALIGRIDNGVPFLIGGNTQPMTMPAGGRLFLGINDTEFGDNSGQYTVTVTRLP